MFTSSKYIFFDDTGIVDKINWLWIIESEIKIEM